MCENAPFRVGALIRGLFVCAISMRIGCIDNFHSACINDGLVLVVGFEWILMENVDGSCLEMFDNIYFVEFRTRDELLEFS